MRATGALDVFGSGTDRTLWLPANQGLPHREWYVPGGVGWKELLVSAGRLPLHDVIAALHEVLERRGFERFNPRLAEADPTDWVVSWKRNQPTSRARVAVDPRGARHLIGTADGVTVYADSRALVRVAGIRSEFSWDDSELDVDELAYTIAGVIESADRFLPPDPPGTRVTPK